MNIGRAEKASQWAPRSGLAEPRERAANYSACDPTSCLCLLSAGVVLAACGGSEPNHSPTAIVVISGNNQTGGAGQQLAAPLIVQVNDKGG